MEKRQNKSYQNKFILVIDDDREMNVLLKKVLEKEGYRVETALNGFQGLLLVTRNNYDLVITDLKMPGMSGLDLIKQAREMSPDLKIILITAYSGVENYIQAMGSGAFEFMNKPVKMRDLKIIVQKAMMNNTVKEEVY